MSSLLFVPVQPPRIRQTGPRVAPSAFPPSTALDLHLYRHSRAVSLEPVHDLVHLISHRLFEPGLSLFRLVLAALNHYSSCTETIGTAPGCSSRLPVKWYIRGRGEACFRWVQVTASFLRWLPVTSITSFTFGGELCRGDTPVRCLRAANSLSGSWQVLVKVIVVIEVNGYCSCNRL